MKKTFTFDRKNGAISEIFLDNNCISSGKTPIFSVQLRCENGVKRLFNAFDAKECIINGEETVYNGFFENLSVKVTTKEAENEVSWEIEVVNNTAFAIESVVFPCFSVGKLKKDGGNGEILLPYNEGVLIDEAHARDKMFPSEEIEYPSKGSYYMFPYMLSSQFMAYLSNGKGLYIGAHDEKRAPKSLDFKAKDNGIEVFVKNFTGLDYGQSYTMNFPIVTKTFDGYWQDGAEIYREWFEKHLPPKAVKIKENFTLPEWYKDSPIIIAYPVRGIHDMDKMEPNALFPYVNALPIIDEIAKKTETRVMVLLMHWEGTAPWAPPYVWPPYGGEESLNEFLAELHKNGNLLGVYCSGFGWTLQSNLISEYNKKAEWKSTNVKNAMCAAPNGEIWLSNICTGQRSGYDICPCSELGRKILTDAYSPLFESGLDYAQILDQNHGGSQYFCYSREHGHNPMPGAYMTENMQDMLSGWNDLAPNMLFGCESACAEPYIGNLRFSDNRFELNYYVGRPVPLYSYLYHEYLRNFMGNQVCCPFDTKEESLCMRLAYSFAAGDALSITLMPTGDFMPYWGCRDFSVLPNKERALTFIKNLMRFYREEAKPYLHCGKMIKPQEIKVDSVSFKTVFGTTQIFPSVFTTAYTNGQKSVQIFVNHTEKDVPFTFNGKAVTVKALDASLIEL